MGLPSPALVVAVIALVVATGGTSYAVAKLPRNSVGAIQIKRDAVTSAKVKAQAITTAKLADGSVTGAKVLDGSLTGADLAAGTLAAAYRSDRDASTPLPLSSSSTTVLSTPTLPAGSYVLLARANVRETGGALTTATCSIGDDAAQAIPLASGDVVALSLVATTTLSSAGTASLSCLETSGGGALEVRQASVTAIRVESITR